MPTKITCFLRRGCQLLWFIFPLLFYQKSIFSPNCFIVELLPVANAILDVFILLQKVDKTV